MIDMLVTNEKLAERRCDFTAAGRVCLSGTRSGRRRHDLRAGLG